jgi:hypothetical protein
MLRRPAAPAGLFFCTASCSRASFHYRRKTRAHFSCARRLENLSTEQPLHRAIPSICDAGDTKQENYNANQSILGLRCNCFRDGDSAGHGEGRPDCCYKGTPHHNHSCTYNSVERISAAAGSAWPKFTADNGITKEHYNWRRYLSPNRSKAKARIDTDTHYRPSATVRPTSTRAVLLGHGFKRSLYWPAGNGGPFFHINAV